MTHFNDHPGEGGPRIKNPGIKTFPGKIIRLDNRPSKKDLIKLDVCIEDSSDYSLYYFNITKKPVALKLGGNIIEFAPPRNKFKINIKYYIYKYD